MRLAAEINSTIDKAAGIARAARDSVCGSSMPRRRQKSLNQTVAASALIKFLHSVGSTMSKQLHLNNCLLAYSGA
jgi:hypothetical protein